jgi:hypothetical protein
MLTPIEQLYSHREVFSFYKLRKEASTVMLCKINNNLTHTYAAFKINSEKHEYNTGNVHNINLLDPH